MQLFHKDTAPSAVDRFDEKGSLVSGETCLAPLQVNLIIKSQGLPWHLPRGDLPQHLCRASAWVFHPVQPNDNHGKQSITLRTILAKRLAVASATACQGRRRALLVPS